MGLGVRCAAILPKAPSKSSLFVIARTVFVRSNLPRCDETDMQRKIASQKPLAMTTPFPTRKSIVETVRGWYNRVVRA